ncbi:MAG: AI-2E family transporter [Syntrophobacteraceae bacterium]|nr:AI-2E family transporter [Syntrophobacteraceae bacterium]
MNELDEPGKEFHGTGKTYRPFLLVVLFFSLYLAYLILKPFLDTLLLSIILASLLYPLQVYLVRLYRGRKNLAALTIVFLFTFLIAIPVFFFASALVAQGLQSINQINDWLRAGNLQRLTHDPKILEYIEWFQDKFAFLEIHKLDIQSNLLQLSKNVGQFILSRGATLLGNAAILITHFLVMIFLLFYLVRDGAEMLEKGRYFSPLRKEQEDRILGTIRMVSRSVFMGCFLTALCQGVVGGIGLSIVGIPGLFWGTVVAFSSLIPLVGTALVWVPCVFYLLLFGSMKSAIFLAAWFIVLVGSLDNFLRPYLMRGQGTLSLSPFYIFLAIIGGVQYFGLVGVLYGPLCLAFAMVMLAIYGVEYREDLLSGDKTAPLMTDSDETK